MNIPFPKTLLSMQSFLGILKYYSWFIEDFAIYASVLKELREANFHKIRRSHTTENECSSSYDHVRNTQIDDDRGQRPAGDHDHQLVTMNFQDQIKVKESGGEHTGFSSLGEGHDCVHHVGS